MENLILVEINACSVKDKLVCFISHNTLQPLIIFLRLWCKNRFLIICATNTIVFSRFHPAKYLSRVQSNGFSSPFPHMLFYFAFVCHFVLIDNNMR